MSRLDEIFTGGLKFEPTLFIATDGDNFSVRRESLKGQIKHLMLELINDPSLFKLRLSTGQKIWLDRDELRQRVEEL